MAIFSKKEEKTTKEESPKKAPAKKPADKPKEKKAAKPIRGGGANLTKVPTRIIKTPRITEKAAYMTVNHTYVFEVAQDATKRDVVAAIKALYNVTPRKVNMVIKRPRAFVSRFRGRRGVKTGMKKAYVFLKKGDKIDLA
jgi:large subunit ribosomal protein L23